MSYPYVNRNVDKKVLGDIVNTLAERYEKVEVAASLDALKAAGFHWATRSGVTIAISDVATPANKQEILDRYETLAAKVQDQYETGLITNPERRQELIEIWTRATNEVDVEMRKSFPQYNTVQTMVGSGARGNWMQVRQIAGMRGLVSNPKGEIIPRPIKSNYREGLSVSSTSSRRTVPVRVWPTRPSVRPTRVPHPSSGRRVAGRHRARGRLRHRAWPDDADRRARAAGNTQ